jgi:UDP-glucose 4-epimerase
MKVLVLGSEGFIGNHLVRYFLAQGYDVHGCDLGEPPSLNYTYAKVSSSFPEWDQFFSDGDFDYCINAAGSGNVSYSVMHPLVDFEANTLQTIRVLDAIRRSCPSCNYLFISSAAVYGNPEGLPIAEETRCSPLSPYGWHKLISEHLCKEYTDIYGLKTSIVRPFSVYGPGLRKQLFWDVYMKYASGKKRLELYGTGEESRDFIYVNDLVRAIDTILKSGPAKAEIYNLASGIETSIKDVMQLFVHFLEPGCQVTFNKEVRKGDPLNWRADISKLQSLGFTTETKLEEGLRIHAQWLKRGSRSTEI